MVGRFRGEGVARYVNAQGRLLGGREEGDMASRVSRSTLFLVVVAAVVVVGAAIAFACVPQRGKLDVTNRANSTEVNASADSNSTD